MLRLGIRRRPGFSKRDPKSEDIGQGGAAVILGIGPHRGKSGCPIAILRAACGSRNAGAIAESKARCIGQNWPGMEGYCRSAGNFSWDGTGLLVGFCISDCGHATVAARDRNPSCWWRNVVPLAGCSLSELSRSLAMEGNEPASAPPVAILAIEPGQLPEMRL